MQITYNHSEVSQLVLDHVQNKLALDDSNTFIVELHEDGITVLVNEDSNESSQSQPAGERPAKKPRRTKAQIEADNKAEAERLAAATAGKSEDTQTSTTSVADAKPTAAVQVEAAGETTPEASVSPGTEAAQVDPTPEVAATVAVVEEEPASEPEPADPVVETQAEAANEAEPEVEQQPKPAQSLFANLRRPKN